MAMPSPLTSIQWWRICLDEAQMIESTQAKTAEMALRWQSIWVRTIVAHIFTVHNCCSSKLVCKKVFCSYKYYITQSLAVYKCYKYKVLLFTGDVTQAKCYIAQSFAAHKFKIPQSFAVHKF